MAEASVTLKLTPAEFDLVREAIALAHSEAKETVADMSAHASDRQKARAQALLLQDLGARLNA